MTLQELIKQAGLRNVDVEQLGMSPGAVSRMLNGHTKGPTGRILAFALDVLLELERADPERAALFRKQYGLRERK